MAFEFSLHRILSLTENEKNQLEYEYGQVYNMLEEVADKLFQLMKKKEQISENLEAKLMQNGAAVSLIQKQELFLQSLEKLIEREQNKYNQIREQLEQKKANLLEKSVEQKKYEKLKGRELLLHRQNIKLKEQKVFDEIAQQKHFYH